MNDLLQISEEQFKEYALEANLRSTIAAQDGLKPIHRRILYSFLTQGLKSNKPHKVSATAVGQVMSLHPHGDAAIYDAAIRLSQDFKMRYPLIDVYGANGSIINDRYASSRYTKIRLSPMGELMLRDINEDAVPMTENYSGDELEPVYLPSVFPSLLCNASLGIGIGLSCNTAPHNLAEVCNAIGLVIDNSDITVEDIMKVMPGPDFPTGGILMNTSDQIKQVYTTGKGSFTLSCRYKIEMINGQYHIIITEIPYLFNIEKHITNQIKKMVLEDEYPFIDNYADNCGNGKIEYHIILTKGANVYQVQQDLKEHGILQATIKINQTINKNNVFYLMGIKDLIKEYLDNRHNCIIRTAQYRKNKALEKLHIREGLIIALEDIDRVVEIIKTSKNRLEASSKLISTYQLDELQTKAILDMRLARLTSMEVESVREEIEKLKQEIQNFTAQIEQKPIRDTMIKEDLKALKALSDKRRTEIRVKEDNLKEQQEIIVVLEKDKTLKALNPENLKTSNRGTKGSSLSKEGITDILITETNKEILVFDSDGYFSTFNSNFVPIVDNMNSKGVDYSSFLNCGDIIKIANLENKKYLIFATAQGYLKKTLATEYRNFKKSTQALRLHVDDKLLYAGFANDDENIIIINKNNKIVNYKVEEIKATGRVTYGMKGSLGGIKSCTLASTNDILLIWSEDGKGKQVEFKSIPETGKNSSGLVVTEGTVGVANTTGANKLFIVSYENKSIIIDSSEVGIKFLKTKGVKLYNGEIAKILPL